MDNTQTLDMQLKTILENLNNIRDETNDQPPGLEQYVENEISALLDAEAPIREYFGNAFKLVLPEKAHEFVDKRIRMSGSVVEGAMLA